MTKNLSLKLSFFSFWLIVVVVLLHSQMIIKIQEPLSFFNYLQYLISGKLAQIAVPLFFMISGYLFFINIKKEDSFISQKYLVKLKKKVHTLFVPYVLWSVFWFVFMFLLQIFPYTSSFFNQPLYSLSNKEIIYNLIIYPLNYPFWFLRELMIYTLITPVLFYIIKKFKVFVFLVLLIFSFFQESLFSIGGIKVFHIYPLLYFSIGCFMGIKKKNIEISLKSSSITIILLFWFILNNISVYLENLKINWYFQGHLQLFINLLGCVGLWFLYDLFNRRNKVQIKEVYAYSFFIFAFHGIPILFLKKSIEKLPVPNSLIGFGYYILVFFVGCLLSISMGYLLKKYANKVFRVLTGDRKNHEL